MYKMHQLGKLLCQARGALGTLKAGAQRVSDRQKIFVLSFVDVLAGGVAFNAIGDCGDAGLITGSGVYNSKSRRNK
jgi:hypothetical protein